LSNWGLRAIQVYKPSSRAEDTVECECLLAIAVLAPEGPDNAIPHTSSECSFVESL